MYVCRLHHKSTIVFFKLFLPFVFLVVLLAVWFSRSLVYVSDSRATTWAKNTHQKMVCCHVTKHLTTD